MRSVRTHVLLLLTSLSLASAAAAQDSTVDRARAAFEEGRNHHNDRRYLLAAEAFQRAYDLMREANLPNAGVILFNLGTSYDEIPGREREARNAYARYLEEAAPSDAQAAERIAVVQDRIRELDLRIAASGGGGGGGGTTISPVGPILLGVGGAALLGGAIAGGVLAAENDAFLAMCTDGVCPISARSSAEAVQDIATVTDVLLISGAVIAATGLVLTLVLHEEAPAPVAAGCGPERCDVIVRGAF
jgi:hypothetical protein